MVYTCRNCIVENIKLDIRADNVGQATFSGDQSGCSVVQNVVQKKFKSPFRVLVTSCLSVADDKLFWTVASHQEVPFEAALRKNLFCRIAVALKYPPAT